MKPYPTTRRLGTCAFVAALLVLTWSSHVLARSAGMINKAQNANGCNCHSNSPNADGLVAVVITGPMAVVPSATANYTITVYGGPADSTTGGFNLEADSGTLIAGGNSQLDTGELTHVNNASRSWDFSWTAPATEGTSNFYAAAQATNGSGSGGDSWNWYGNAVSTPFVIQVASQVGVDPQLARGLWLSPAHPNPFAGATQIRFSLAESGPAKLAVFDAAGRRVTTLFSGGLPAGAHEVTWTGLSNSGRRVESGMYLITLESGGERITTKAIKMTR